MVDFTALAAKAVAAGANQTVAKAGGGDYEPPAAGPALCRFVGYVECGKQKGTFQGKETVKEKVLLVFELVGKRHAVEADAQPHRITIEETYSLNEKSNFFKLFNRMNYAQDAQHIVQLLGRGFKCEVVHDKWTDRQGKERTSAVLRNSGGYTIAPPRKEDEDSETGWVDVAVPAAKSQLRCFLWEHADMEQWASLYIEGEYPERKDAKGVVIAPAKSKNTLQHKVMSAVNFNGSPIHTLLLSNGAKLDLPDVGEDPDMGKSEGEVPPSPSRSQTSTMTSHSDALGSIV